MTVSSTTTKNSYSGNGSTTVFAYTFKIFDEDDIAVILRDDATAVETVQTITTNYTVSGVGDAGGGNITFVTAPATGKTVVLLRSTPLSQLTDYSQITIAIKSKNLICTGSSTYSKFSSSNLVSL